MCSTCSFGWSPQSILQLRHLGQMVLSPRALDPWLMSGRGQNVLGTPDQPLIS